MNRFYSDLLGEWLDKPAVCLAFGVRWPLDVYYTQAVRRGEVTKNICSLHKAKQLNAINPQQFLRTLHTKRLTQSLPVTIYRYNLAAII